VNKGLAASCPSHFASQATIPPFDFTSFTTDHQQTWLSQPPSSAPASATNVQHNFNQDFSLFGAAQETPARHPQHSRARATSSIAPNFNLIQQPHPHIAHNSGSTQVQKLQSNGHISTSYNNRSNSSPTLRNQHQQHQRGGEGPMRHGARRLKVRPESGHEHDAEEAGPHQPEAPHGTLVAQNCAHSQQRISVGSHSPVSTGKSNT